jgi:hypothetical protein
MRWRMVVAALGLGMIAGAAWMVWDQRLESHPFWRAAATPPSAENIPLMVQHGRGVLRLRWSTTGRGIRDAAHGTLTITDGAHQSRLELDARELGTGLASYWPDGSHVGFRLETDSGASGYIEAPVEDRPEKPVVGTKPDAEPEAEPDQTAAPPKRRPKPAAATSHAKPIDDGLEWTEQPPRRDSRWVRLRRRIAFWRPAGSDRD